MYEIISNPFYQLWAAMLISLIIGVIFSFSSNLFQKLVVTCISVSPVFLVSSYAGQHALIVVYGLGLIVATWRLKWLDRAAKLAIIAAILFHISKDIGYIISHLQRSHELTENLLHDMLILTDILEFTVFVFLVIMRERRYNKIKRIDKINETE